MKKSKLFILSLSLLLLVFATGCRSNVPQKPSQNSTPTPAPSNVSTAAVSTGPVSYKIIEAYPNLSFNRPLAYINAADNTNRAFVVEQDGKILVFQNDTQVKSSQIFLNVTNLVDSSSAEKGLLGLAFHPNYKSNGFFYINYTDRTNTVIARYKVDPKNPDKGLENSKTVLLTFPQPFANHKGGSLVFGPDGYLYIGTGDGGSAGDPNKNGQNLNSLLGKMLRIDVNTPGNGKLYSIPSDNPFYGNKQGHKEEIYAYGFRNPWKYSFDKLRGWLWVADVGQDKVEEIDIVKKGENYGWNLMEGSLGYPSGVKTSIAGLINPIWEYQHDLGKSITGGYAYYGSRTPMLNGAYVYGDFITGRIWELRVDTAMKASNKIILNTKLNISSFGLDQENELYIVDYNGKIYKLTE